MKNLLLVFAVALLPACGSLPVKPAGTERSSAPARFDDDRDDELENDLTRSSVTALKARAC